jgi:hypothetical protein
MVAYLSGLIAGKLGRSGLVNGDILTYNCALGPWCAVAVSRNSVGILQTLCPPCFLSGCCHEHHLVPPDPQSSARRTSPSDDAPSVRRVHSICFIYRFGTTLTQYDLKFRLRRHSSYLLMFLDWNSSQWKLCSLEIPHTADCTCMTRVLKS